ncbi:hypothetical protein GO986_16455 [Deinococcus sp. HMF7620]|uniref:Uncharacterized protein n=1 Tax=Deinococcus arboris TaxID=2682977 RepID=A0A7C9LMM6_9DEIO|nr:hypothetical protein [Deinococcus arboris]MVN88338.1 hypothetical protein [Deinococcus arboris]
MEAVALGSVLGCLVYFIALSLHLRAQRNAARATVQEQAQALELSGERRDALAADLRHAQALAHLYAEERDDALDCNQHLFDALQAERARNAPVPAPLPTWREA